MINGEQHLFFVKVNKGAFWYFLQNVYEVGTKERAKGFEEFEL